MTEESTDFRRRPGQGKYARPEIEFRYLVSDQHPPVSETRLIHDRYISGTTLRLREVCVDGECVWKLTQKVRVQPDDPYEVAITNMYLQRSEYELLAQLPAATLTKTRGFWTAGAYHVAVDVFHGRLEGLRLAEIDVTTGAPETALPSWFGRDVTRDSGYSGGQLATASDEELRLILAQ